MHGDVTTAATNSTPNFYISSYAASRQPQPPQHPPSNRSLSTIKQEIPDGAEHSSTPATATGAPTSRFVPVNFPPVAQPPLIPNFVETASELSVHLLAAAAAAAAGQQQADASAAAASYGSEVETTRCYPGDRSSCNGGGGTNIAAASQKAVAFLAGPKERIHVLGSPIENCPRCWAEGERVSWRPHRHLGELKIRYICERHLNTLDSPHHFDVPLCPICNHILYLYDFNSMLGVSNARRLHKYVLKCGNRHVLPLLDLFCQTKKGGDRCNANFKLQWCYGTMVKRCEAQKNRDHDLWWVRYKNEWKQRRTIIRYKKDFLSHLNDTQRSLLLGLGLEGAPPPDPKLALGPTFDSLVASANAGGSPPLAGPQKFKKRDARGNPGFMESKRAKLGGSNRSSEEAAAAAALPVVKSDLDDLVEDPRIFVGTPATSVGAVAVSVVGRALLPTTAQESQPPLPQLVSTPKQQLVQQHQVRSDGAAVAVVTLPRSAAAVAAVESSKQRVPSVSSSASSLSSVSTAPTMAASPASDECFCFPESFAAGSSNVYTGENQPTTALLLAAAAATRAAARDLSAAAASSESPPSSNAGGDIFATEQGLPKALAALELSLQEQFESQQLALTRLEEQLGLEFGYEPAAAAAVALAEAAGVAATTTTSTGGGSSTNCGPLKLLPAAAPSTTNFLR